jgi:hypothetical protein
MYAQGQHLLKNQDLLFGRQNDTLHNAVFTLKQLWTGPLYEKKNLHAYWIRVHHHYELVGNGELWSL